MQWIELTIKTAPAAIDLVCDRLTVLGFDSFIIDDQEQFHEFLEQNRQYWDYVDEGLEKQMQGLSQIRLYLEEGPAVPETISHLKDQLAALRAQYPATDFGSLDVQLANVKDEDWENNWKRYYQPLPIGERLLVVPEWLHPENPENRVEVLLDPGMIFGTGAHASTQMCMRELERAIQGGERVLDLGSGSGILSITAILLGAAHATGVDIDPKAEDIARENAAINQIFSDRFTAVTGDVIGDRAMMESLRGHYDVVLANIVADVIIPLSRVVPEFLQEKQSQLIPDEHLTGKQIRTPRGSFYVSDMSVEQMKEAGYGLHHQSDDGKYLIMGNGTRAFAVAAEQPEKANPLKHIEDTIEQNDNNFDGIINNTPQTPTVDALEQKAKAGEVISLVDLADAIKADKEQGKTAKPEKKPSIRAQLKADKEKAQKKPQKSKSQDLERS